MALIVGNWKMNGLKDGLGEARAIAQGAASIGEDQHQLVICPPATSLMIFSEVLKATPVFTGGQDCHPEVSGAHTGRISAEMLADAGASYCIVGHSECRDELGDNDEILSLKVKAVLRAGLVPIFCVGESLAVRDDGNAESFVTEQLAVIQDVTDKVVVAYEPIWAIGTGRTPTTEQIEQMHTTMRAQLGGRTPLLYGGSVKPSNAEDILKVTDVNGALVGGASLKAEDFLAIASAA